MGTMRASSFVNLHTSNGFNLPDRWDVKLAISCRTQYFGVDSRDRFVPQGADHYERPTPNLLQVAVIPPFTKDQIESYVEQYIPLEPYPWEDNGLHGPTHNRPKSHGPSQKPFSSSHSRWRHSRA